VPEQKRPILTTGALEEPAIAVGSRAAGGVQESGDFGRKAQPQGGAER